MKKSLLRNLSFFSVIGLFQMIVIIGFGNAQLIIKDGNSINSNSGKNKTLMERLSQIDSNENLKNDIENNLNYVDGELIIKYKKNKINLAKGDSPFKNGTLSSLKNTKIIKTNKNLNIVSIKSDIDNIEKTIRELSLDPSIEYIQPNYRYYNMYDNPNDTHFEYLWGLNNVGQEIRSIEGTIDADIDWNDSMDIITGSDSITGTIVAIIDDGVFFDHTDLKDNMRDGTNCLDNNGDYLGGCQHGYDFYNDDKDPTPKISSTTNDYSHGTHVAGIIGAIMDNGLGTVGVNNEAKIMALKSSLTTSNIVDAITFSSENGAKVINASWGCYASDNGGSHLVCGDTAVYNDQAIIDAINSFDGLFITAAGNGGGDGDSQGDEHNGSNLIMYPCDLDLDNIICVTATNNKDELATFSDYGSSYVHVGAPGVDILSSYKGEDTLMGGYFTNDPLGGISSMLTGGEKNNFGAGSDGEFYGVYTDYGNIPYVTGANSYIQTGVDLSGYDKAYFTMYAWCDTPANGTSVYEDYYQFSIFDGESYITSEYLKYDEEDLPGSYTLSGYVGKYGYHTIDVSDYATENFSFRINWITDDKEESNRGCFFDDIEITGFKSMVAYMDGTSMATPHVAGIASSIWSYKPDLTTSEVRDLILYKGDSIDSLMGKTITGKRVNLYNSLASITDPAVENFQIFINQEKNEITNSGSIYTSSNPAFTWDPPEGQGIISGYNIEINSEGGLYYYGITNLTGFNGLDFSSTGDQVFTTEDTYTISIIGVNNVGNTGHSVTSTIYVDLSSPSTPNLLNYMSGGYHTGEDITLNWSEAIDSGIGIHNLSGYTVDIYYSNEGGSITGTINIITGSNSITTTLPGEYEYEWSVVAMDKGYNESESSLTGSFIADWTPPGTCTGLVLNDGDMINSQNHQSISLSGYIYTGDIGSTIHYTISSSSGSVSGTGSINSSDDNYGYFNFTGIDISGISDGTITGTVLLSDLAGNLGSSSYTTGSKEAIPPSGSVSFLSGDITNLTSTNLLISSTEDSTYYISGDITTILTGNINGSGNVSVTFTGEDGQKEIIYWLVDSADNVSDTYTGNIIVDTEPPEIQINSHTNEQQVSSSDLTLTGTITDEIGLDVEFTLSDEFSNDFTLTGGENILTVTGTDYAGNNVTETITIIRISNTENINHEILTNKSVEISFETDIISDGFVKYGTSSENLDNIESGSNDMNHEIILTGLTEDTTYYYQVGSKVGNYTGNLSEIQSFKTPFVKTDSFTGSTYLTGSLGLSASGTNLTGYTFNGTGSITLISTSGSNQILIYASGTSITSSGGNWNGVIMPPTIIQIINNFSVPIGYQLTGDFYDIGSSESELIFSGSSVEIKLFVGTSRNGETFYVYKSTDRGSTFGKVSECVISEGFCTFTTNQLSVFKLAEPNDTTPDSFDFTDQSDLSLSETVTSNTITVSGINKGVTASTNHGTLVVNGTDTESSSTTVFSGDTVAITFTSSSSHDNTTTITVTIGETSDNFTVTTEEDTSSSSGGGGGGGGGGGYNYYLMNQNQKYVAEKKGGIEKNKEIKAQLTKKSNKLETLNKSVSIVKNSIKEILSDIEDINKDYYKVSSKLNNKIFFEIDKNIELSILLGFENEIENMLDSFELFNKSLLSFIEDNSSVNKEDLLGKYKELKNSIDKYNKKKNSEMNSDKLKTSTKKLNNKSYKLIYPIFKKETINQALPKVTDKILKIASKNGLKDYEGLVNELNNFYIGLAILKENGINNKESLNESIKNILTIIYDKKG